MTAAVDLARLAKALGGDISGAQVLAPGPGHRPRDRSLSVRPADNRDGFVLHSFAGDDWLVCKEFVLSKLGAAPWEPPARQRTAKRPTDVDRTAAALRLWGEAVDPLGTPVALYLRRRGLVLPDEAAGASIRWHPHAPFGEGARTTCMLALVRNVMTDAPQAVHRTSVSGDGEKLPVDGRDRMALGCIAGGAIKLTPNGDVTTVLGVGEGIETALSLRHLPGCEALPIWSLVNASGLAAFPILPGVEALWVANDNDPAGLAAADAVRQRWQAAGCEVVTVMPRAEGADLNDVAGRAHG